MVDSIPPEGPRPMPSIEKEIVSGIKGKIATTDEFNSFKERSGFNKGHHGTWRSTDKDAFLYIKPQFVFHTEGTATTGLQTITDLTKKGIFFPDTEWGVYKDGSDYQIYAVMRRLETQKPGQPQNPEWQRLLKPEEVVDKDISQAEWYSQWYSRMMQEGSHILEWYRRLDPNFDKEKKSSDILIGLLNPFEASHWDNWAWDPKTGKLYPVDIEVVNLNQEE